jgi:hypothetical protein
MKTKMLLFLAAASIAIPAHAQQWVQSYSYVDEIPKEDIIYQWYNTEPTEQIIEQSCGMVSYTRILGSTWGAPWTAKFTPLTNQGWPVTYGVKAHPVPGHTTCERYAVYVQEQGEEMWTREHEEYVDVAIRNRLWDIPSPVTILHRHRSGPPQ